MEHMVIQNLWAVSEDKGLFRQWHPRFTTVIGQVGRSHEEIVYRLVKVIDLGNVTEKIVRGLKENL